MNKQLKPLAFAVLALSLAACNEQKAARHFAVEGAVKNAAAPKIYLEENVPNGQPTIMDSAELKADDKFSLQAPVKEEALYQLRLGGRLTPFAFLINDVPKATITADLSNTQQPYTVQNSPASDALLHFDKTIYSKGTDLFAAGRLVDSLRKSGAPDSVINSAYGNVESKAAELKEFVRGFLAKTSSPVLTLYALGSYQNAAANLGVPGFNQVETGEILRDAAARFPQHAALQSVQKSMASAKASDFTQPGVDGKPVSLSSFRGKWVLLDFWASWCRPCRMDNPNVVKAYNEFKDKNFTVFGVSLDQNRDAWLKAIQSDGLTWTHASDLQFWNNAAAVQYGVQSIPANFLIDPQGNIVAQDLHGEEIVQTLKNLLK